MFKSYSKFACVLVSSMILGCAHGSKMTASSERQPASGTCKPNKIELEIKKTLTLPAMSSESRVAQLELQGKVFNGSWNYSVVTCYLYNRKSAEPLAIGPTRLEMRAIHKAAEASWVTEDDAVGISCNVSGEALQPLNEAFKETLQFQPVLSPGMSGCASDI